MAAEDASSMQYGYPVPGPQNPTGQTVMDHVYFLGEERWKEAQAENQYDLVIVGTSFCGLAVASRALKRNPATKILMIERGTFFLPEHFQNLPQVSRANGQYNYSRKFRTLSCLGRRAQTSDVCVFVRGSFLLLRCTLQLTLLQKIGHTVVWNLCVLLDESRSLGLRYDRISM